MRELAYFLGAYVRQEGEVSVEHLTNGGNVDLVLEELHAKKRWLDTVIAGLEMALDSPQHRLLEMAAETFDLEPNGVPKVDLGGGPKAELTQLAVRVGGSRPSRRAAPRVRRRAT